MNNAKRGWTIEGGITGKNITEALSKITHGIGDADITSLSISKQKSLAKDNYYTFIAGGPNYEMGNN